MVTVLPVGATFPAAGSVPKTPNPQNAVGGHVLRLVRTANPASRKAPVAPAHRDGDDDLSDPGVPSAGRCGDEPRGHMVVGVRLHDEGVGFPAHVREPGSTHLVSRVTAPTEEGRA